MRIDIKNPRVTGENNFTHVYVLDCTGSMEGPKFTAAKKGLKSSIQEIEKSALIGETHTFAVLFMVEVNRVYWISKAANSFKDIEDDLNTARPFGANTPLDETIIKVLSGFKEHPGYVLYRILTDGKDNRGTDKTKGEANDLILNLPKDQTIAFMCTQYDAPQIRSRYYALTDDMILTYENTGKGVEEADNVTMVATQSYFKTIREGGEAPRGLYKDLK